LEKQADISGDAPETPESIVSAATSPASDKISNTIDTKPQSSTKTSTLKLTFSAAAAGLSPPLSKDSLSNTVVIKYDKRLSSFGKTFYIKNVFESLDG